jgi:opacity protein-like surface antigen
MKRFFSLLACILLAASAPAARAQVEPSVNVSQFSLTAGVSVSAFQPDFAGNWGCSGTACPPSLYYPIAQASDYPLIGPGAYVDVKFRRWVQLEAEGRWLRFNRYQDIHEDNYLIGPRVPVVRFRNATVYGKVLGGYSRMDLGYGYHGTFTAMAFGGGMDIRLSRRVSIRAFDGEYQYWPTWGNVRLHPYGGSAGIAYTFY